MAYIYKAGTIFKTGIVICYVNEARMLEATV